jgi:hypothetical protein
MAGTNAAKAMNSNHRKTASHMNGRKSGGPRTAAGKAIASRNAVKHGLAALVCRPPQSSPEVEQLALAICEGDTDPQLLETARAVARDDLVMGAIRAHQVTVVERLRDQTAIALSKGDNSMSLAIGRVLQAWLSNREIEATVPKLMEKYKDQMHPPNEAERRAAERGSFIDEFGFVPIRLKALLEAPDDDEEHALEVARAVLRKYQRDGYEVLAEAIPDLIRLDRYERRVWSRHKRAFHQFLNLKFTKDYCRRISDQHVDAT